ncbi:MAG: alpha/beta hydrolase fold domain-containing protein [Erythrobacter sp.]|uniref:alpha/beta hydrolase family protein n=1 Tax=Erythrobacter sp. TaxID=1042 RepID=UPI0025EF89DD|nr:alpha/beta hydrolase fold domain-containing protein [Erythrobacter sp.]MCL9999749.1 alpha/beta hydrolase fold domain-containing protein [Erythrobacter sp.]
MLPSHTSRTARPEAVSAAMRHIPLLLVAAACTPATPAPQEAASAVQPSNATYGTDANLAASKPDAILRYADHPRGFAELRLPEGEGPFPLAVIYHGGCWKTGIASQAYMAPLATRWQSLGIATLNVDYREVGDGGGWPGSFADWAASAKLIDEVAARYPVERARVTLVGHSAGALPVQWLTAGQEEDGPLGTRAPIKARAGIVLDGPGDVGAEQPAFDALCQFSAVEPFMGAAPAADLRRYAAIAPATHAPQLAELLFVQAKLPAPSAATQAALASGGASVTVRENAGASHFAIITPGNPVYEANEAAMLAVIK